MFNKENQKNMAKEEKWLVINGEKFYYTEERLFHGRGKMNLDIAKENLNIFYNIIEQTDIRYGLFWGTLLGAIRENNFISHDEDTDVYVLGEDKEKFLKLLCLFKKQGLLLVRYEPEMLSLMRNNEYIDVSFFKLVRKFGISKVRVCSNSFEFSPELLENVARISFLDMLIPIPSNAEKLIVKLYGKNWKIPMIDFKPLPNTLYKKIGKYSLIFKRLPFYSYLANFMKKLFIKIGI